MQSRKAHAKYDLYKLTTLTIGDVTYYGYYLVGTLQDDPDAKASHECTQKMFDEGYNTILPVWSDISCGVGFSGEPIHQ